MKIFLLILLLSNTLIAEKIRGGDKECYSKDMSSCTEEFLLRDQLFIEKYGKYGKKSVRQTVQLKN